MTLSFNKNDNFDQNNQSNSENQSSIGKDMFIVGFSVFIIVLCFFLYQTIVNLDMEVAFPRACRKVIDSYGKVVQLPDEKISSEATKRYIQIGVIFGLISFFVFRTTVLAMVVASWPMNSFSTVWHVR